LVGTGKDRTEMDGELDRQREITRRFEGEMQSKQRKGERSEGSERDQKVERETSSSIIIQNMSILYLF